MYSKVFHGKFAYNKFSGQFPKALKQNFHLKQKKSSKPLFYVQ